MSVRMIWALTLADFRERVRRPSFLFVLLGAAALGYFAVPPDTSGYMLLRVGNYRGVYDSAYVGALIALVGGAWLTVGGFFVVKNAIARDEATGVGQILAATPMRTVVYTVGKFLSNLLVLGAMVVLLALTALLMVLVRGEAGEIDLVALWMPFLLLSMPMMALTAAAAVLFETIRPLRRGLGNIVWFVLAIAGLGQSVEAGGAFDVLGVGTVATSLEAAIVATYPDPGDTGLAIGFSDAEGPLRRYEWAGLDLTAELVLLRTAVLLFALGVAVLAAGWFTRFTPTSGTAGRRSEQETEALPAEARPTRFGAPVSAAVRGWIAARLLLSELRILVKGISYWWWTGAAALFATGLFVPYAQVINPMLPIGWIWPVLMWSRLGTQQTANGVDLLVAASVAGRRRLAAEWTAGVLITAVTGLAPLLRMAVAADWSGVAAWGAGLLFIPSLALAVGTLTRTARAFQALYLGAWYAVMNGVTAIDYMGTLRPVGQSAGDRPLLVAGVAAVLVLVTFVTREARHAWR
nr:hypothetical protein [uncultured bacterium]